MLEAQVRIGLVLFMICSGRRVFLNTQYDTIYSYMKYTNIGSYSTAIANGMQKVKEYPDPKNTISYAYAITREEWKEMKEE